jgi:hypothetical protein
MDKMCTPGLSEPERFLRRAVATSSRISSIEIAPDTNTSPNRDPWGTVEAETPAFSEVLCDLIENTGAFHSTRHLLGIDAHLRTQRSRAQTALTGRDRP